MSRPVRRASFAVPVFVVAMLALMPVNSLAESAATDDPAQQPGAQQIAPGAYLVPQTSAASIDCPNDGVCMYMQSNYQGDAIIVKNPTNGWVAIVIVGYDNNINSWKNHKNIDGKLAKNSDGSGSHKCMNANDNEPDLGDFNNEASALRVYNSGGECG